MVEIIEITNLDLRYEKFRLRSKRIEQELLASIIEIGIQEPLKGIHLEDGARILLDGFKRYRCAKKLNIKIVPYTSFGSDEPLGIIKLIRASTERPLTILEQAKMIDELEKVHGMLHRDIADLLQKEQSMGEYAGRYYPRDEYVCCKAGIQWRFPGLFLYVHPAKVHTHELNFKRAN